MGEIVSWGGGGGTPSTAYLEYFVREIFCMFSLKSLLYAQYFGMPGLLLWNLKGFLCAVLVVHSNKETHTADTYGIPSILLCCSFISI